MLLCVIVQLLSACNVLALAVSEIEYLALQSLYNSTNGNDWVWDGSGAEWNFNRLQDPCLDRWEGVTCPNGCNPDSCTILGLALPRHNMTGSIPEDIDGLLNLVYLDLSYNRVGGSLPESIGGLNSLQYLNLEFMCLMGKFPTAANFSALQFLNLRHNFFHGPIPGAKNLPLIKDINLSYNRADTHVDVMDVDTNITYLHSQCPFYNSTGFEGSVSSSFWGLSMMTNVSLKGNSLTGPILIDTSSPLAPLESLHLSNNLLVGPILRLVEYFPSIRYLDLSCNQFNGQIRSEIFSAITEVIYFNISDNIFRGSLPSSIGSLSNIQTLSMFANILQYSIPERITVLSALKHLSLGRGNCFTGPIPDSIGNLTSLEYLEISGAQLTGAIPMSLSNLRKLREINLRYNKEKRILTDVDGVDICQDRYENGGLSGPLHPFWLDMPYIEYIDLSRNWFNMSIPDTFGFANNLKVFSMQDNLMSGNLPNFTGAPSLQRIALDSNFLAGPLPPSYAQLHRLKELSLAQNILTGVIPPEWAEMKDIEVLALNRNFLGRLEAISSALWTLTKLRILYLEYNRFAGSIPSEVSNLVHLEIFSVANNRISGSIPPQLFSMCSRLYAFDVANNSFTGRIPSSVVSAQFLDAFSAEGNKLTNSIPTEFVRLTNLAYLRLGANYLNGTLPDWKYFMPKLEYFSANSNQLTGTIPRSTNDFLKILSVLYLNNNTLDGSIPAGLLHSPSLLLLDLSSNCLQGSIPEVWDSADLAKHQLTLLALYNNKLTGPFPKSVIEHNPFIATFVIYMNIFTGPVPDYTKMPYVNVYAISRNRFTGTLPEYKERPELSRLIYFDVADNNLGGVIPTSLGYHNQIATLFLQNNRFEGTIPTNFSYPDLKDFRLHTNRLTGALPAWVGESDRLGNLFVHQNFLSGDLNLVLHNNRQQLLDHIDVSDNLFTGSLPAGVFTMPKLSSFAASKNCFSGQFPSTLCNTTSLEYLVLDALSSSLTCSSSWNNRIAFFPEFTFYDKLPACLLQVRTLKEIYLSGNGLTGTLPPIENASFRVLQFDNNELTGTIPTSYLRNTRESLSLVRNRFDGKLPNTEISDQLEIRLKLNRLSGRIPDTYKDIKSIDILDGNIFECENARQLPQYDPSAAEYSCGSNLLDYSLFAWLALIFSGFFSILLLRYVVNERVYETISTDKVSDITRPTEYRQTVASTLTTHSISASIKSRMGVVIKSNKWKQFEDVYRWYRTGASLAIGSAVALRKNMERQTFRDTSYVASDSLRQAYANETNSTLTAAKRRKFDIKLTSDTFYKYKYSAENRSSELSRFITSLLIVRSLAVVLAVVIVVIFIPVYLALKSSSDYGTHDIQYAWTFTAGFVSGSTVACIVGVLWLVICALFMWIVHIVYADFFANANSAYSPRQIHDDHLSVDTIRMSNITPTIIFGFVISGTVRQALRSLFYVGVNIVVVSISTYLYIFFLLSENSSSGSKLFVQLGFAIFKMFWNAFGVPMCFLAMNWLDHRTKIFIYVITLFFNNALSIIITTAVSDPSCFFDIWFPIEPDTVEYFGVQCVEFSPLFNRCFEFTVRVFTIEFKTPLVYNYLCASQILRSFIPIFFYVYAGTLFSLPVIFWALSSKQKSYWPKVISKFAPALLWPDDVITEEGICLHLMMPNIVMNTIIGHLMIILTFGIFCPPLALTIAITVFVVSSMWIILLGRYMEVSFLSEKQKECDRVRGHLDHTFSDVWKTPYHTRCVVLIGACMCYGAIIFDYVGDEHGLTFAFICASSMGLLYVIIFFLAFLIRGRRITESSTRMLASYSSKFRVLILTTFYWLVSAGVDDGLVFSDPFLKTDIDEDIDIRGIRLTEYSGSRSQGFVNVENPIFGMKSPGIDEKDV